MQESMIPKRVSVTDPGIVFPVFMFENVYVNFCMHNWGIHYANKSLKHPFFKSS